jgi:hypothetical protein
VLTDIAALLQQIEAAGSFATRRTGAALDLLLEVKGVGPIRFPVSNSASRATGGRSVVPRRFRTPTF